MVVTQEDQVNAIVEAALAEFGKIDVLVNNAGVNCFGLVHEISSEEWDWVLSVNLMGTSCASKPYFRP